TAPMEARAALAISPSVRSGARAISKAATAAGRSVARAAGVALLPVGFASVGGPALVAPALLDGLLHRPLAAADEAVVEPLLLRPVGRGGGAETLGPATRHFAAGGGGLIDFSLGGP